LTVPLAKSRSMPFLFRFVEALAERSKVGQRGRLID
jgi:hypothetical protein